MPQPVAEIEHAAAVVARQRLAVLVEVRDVDHAGLEAQLVRLGDVTAERALDLAEVLGEFDLLVVGDVLVAKDQHRVAVHAGVDRFGLFTGQRLPEIDPGHLAGEDRMDLADREHGRPPGFSRFALAEILDRGASAARALDGTPTVATR